MKRVFHLYILAVLSCLVPIKVTAATHTVTVSNQLDFDNLNQQLSSLLENATDNIIKVDFLQGIYSFHDDHINITNVNAPGVSIYFEGNGSIIMSEGRDYNNGDLYTDEVTPTESFVTPDGKDYNTWSKILRTSNYLVEVVDEAKMICRLNVSELSQLSDKDEEECRMMYIWIPQWYYSRSYKVKKIESGYIYFTVSSLYDINYDYSYGKISQLRFRLSNNSDERGDILIKDNHIYLPNGVDKVRHAKADRLFKLYNTKLKALSISGLKIYGNTKKDPDNPDYNNSRQLVDVNNFKSSSFNIDNCEFRSIQTRVINLISTNNVTIGNSTFEDCYSYGVFQDRASRVFDMHDCLLHNVNKRINNTFAIFCRGADFHVHDNIITNFGYSAIAAGIWDGHNDVTLNCDGVIERNEIYYTQPYYEKADEHNLMDSGAIYLYTITNKTTVRYNHIHHYGGAYGNHGIFCDDGAKNFQIYGNTITNLIDGYSIDSRRVNGNDSPFGGLNVNNVIRDNIVDCAIRFQGNEMSNNGCIFDGNIHLDGNYESDIISNVNQ